MEYPRSPQRITPSFALSYIERALHECLGERKFGKPEMLQVSSFFSQDSPECVYCGSLAVERWDHVIPVKHGGETVLGNMVPACSACDDSRQDEPFESWMQSAARLSPKTRAVRDIDGRIDRIKSYMKHFGYERRKLEDRLTHDEQVRLQRVRDQIHVLREDMEKLVTDYVTRVSRREQIEMPRERGT